MYEVSFAGARRIYKDFVVLLEGSACSIQLEDFEALKREVGFEVCSEAFVSDIVKLVGVNSSMLSKCNSLPSRSSAHIEDELAWLWVESLGCEKGGRVEVVMGEILSCSFRRCEGVLLNTSQLHLFSFQLRIIRECVDQGGMTGRLEEGGVEGVVPAFGAVDGGIVGVEGGRGGG